VQEGRIEKKNSNVAGVEPFYLPLPTVDLNFLGPPDAFKFSVRNQVRNLL
jgi:hypothetical protein